MWKEKVVHILLLSCATMSILIVALIFLFIGKESFHFGNEVGFAELLHGRWNPVSFEKEQFGIFSLLTGTLLVTSIAMLFAIPLGVCSAIYISEIATKWERELLKPFIELLAGIPSVVLGFFGMMVLSPLIKHLFNLETGMNALTGAVLLALMATPTIISISEEALRSVPQAYKQASLALGANPIQTIFKVTLPAAYSGIMASIMLGIGRVIGETMAVMMVTGNSPSMTFSPFDSVRTMTATIAAEMGEVPFGGTHYYALYAIGAVLLLFTFGLNILGRRSIRKRVQK